jgi:hypothetical protein
MFNQMDGIMLDLDEKRTQWKNDLNFAVKFGQQMLSKYYSQVTAMTHML